MIPIIWVIFRRIVSGLRWLLIAAVLLLLLRNSTTQFGQPYYALSSHVVDTHFDYIAWELGAISAKAGQAAAGTHGFITEAERSAFVRSYFDDMATVQGVEAQINALYTDPNVPDPLTASADLRAQRDANRESLEARQTLVESILESQVSAVIVDEDFGLGGQLFPPVWMRFTQRTMLLVASPRDEIDMAHALTVEPIPVDERERIEAEIYEDENLSAVIVPIGGMALYPAMIVETSSLTWAVETFAHEWFHHYLMFFPLGWSTEYFGSGEARIINETTASIFGREIARKVLERYYPDLVPPEREPQTLDTTESRTVEAAPPPELQFRYDREMNITRVTTDRLLAKGRVDVAETYMEARREFLVSQGVGIRKLNQAWFSFYGGYQVAGISAGGEDPTGAAVQQLRDESQAIREWVTLMRGITTREALLQAANIRQEN
jgi:hypothetical protein